mgnify:CR=1 FL=1
MMKSGSDNRPESTPEDRQKYRDAWAKMMVTIWREKIERLHVFDTYKLHQEITENVTSSGSELSTIQHKFMEYGIYQDVGTGNGYRHGNGGDLDFLDPKYREEHARKQKSGKVTLGEPRQPREWFSRAYYASVMVLKEQMAYMYGEEFCGLLVDRIEEANHKRSATLRSRLWGSHKH